MQQHMMSEKHKKKEKRHKLEDENTFYCDICQVSCSGLDNFIQHIEGKKHMKRSAKM
jgi:hypothetical protein